MGATMHTTEQRHPILFVSSCAPRPRDRMHGSFVHEIAKGIVAQGTDVDVFVPVRIFPSSQLLVCLKTPWRFSLLMAAYKSWSNLWLQARGIHTFDNVRYVYCPYTSLPRAHKTGADVKRLTEGRLRRVASQLHKNYSFILGHFSETIKWVDHFSKTLNTPGGIFVHEDLMVSRDQDVSKELEMQQSSLSIIFANSTKTAAQIATLNLKSSIVTACLGLNDVFMRTAQQPLQSDRKDRVIHIVCVSRFFRWKNQSLLLDAAHRWNQNHVAPKIRLTLAGDSGPELHHLRLMARKLSMEDSVVFTRIESPLSTFQALQNQDLFIFPSRFESFGIVAIEAIALGIPVIFGNNIGAQKDLAMAGFHFPTFDQDSADCLLACLSANIPRMPSLLDLTTRARQHVLATYSWRRCAEQIIQAIST